MSVIETIAGVETYITLAQYAHWAVKKYLSYDKNTPRMLDAYAEEKKIGVHQKCVQLLAERLERVEDTEENRKRLDEVLSDEFVWLQRNYEFEAFREARAERSRMLLYAAAGSADLKRSFHEIARTERALRSLEPEDVMVLEKLAEQEEPVFDATGVPHGHIQDQRNANYTKVLAARANRYDVAQDVPVSLDALLVSGCLRLEASRIPNIGSGLVMTKLGDFVRSVLKDYIVVARSEGLMGKSWGNPNVK